MDLRVDPEIQAEGDIAVKDFASGLYAVTTCKLKSDPDGTMQEKWMKLWHWVQASPYQWRKTHELEKLHDLSAPEQDCVVNLYLSIEFKEERNHEAP